jgi:NDP-sugar pyrophosphorylase family protein
MEAVILAGGLGTRLRPLTEHTPKPLVPIATRPFLATILTRLSKAGVRRAVLSTFHQADKVRKASRELRELSGASLKVVVEKEPLGTGGAIRFAWPGGSAACLVLNGDVLSDFDFSRIIHFFHEKQADAVLWVRPVPDVSAFGVIEFDKEKRIRRFLEKPKPGETTSRFINAGVYLFSKRVVDKIPQGRPVSVERETFPMLLKEGYRLFAYDGQQTAYWRDIGTPSNYYQANLDAIKGRLRKSHGSLWGKCTVEGLKSPGCRISPRARIRRSFFGRHCRVEKDARVTDSIVWERCSIGAGAILKRAILGRGVKVLPGVKVKPDEPVPDDQRIDRDSPFAEG